MKKNTCSFTFLSVDFSELSESYQDLVRCAKEATRKSYAPYSHFYVGAAVRLKNGIVLSASNQENVSYPEGTCAERNVLFYAQSQYPDVPIVSMAVAARNEKGYLDHPITPCGACRQVIIESLQRGAIDFNVILYGVEEVLIIPQASALLPLSFSM